MTEPDPVVPEWMDVDGERMFAVDLTPAGFPIGIRGAEEPCRLDEERAGSRPPIE